MIICPILSLYPIIVSVSQAPHQVMGASDLLRIRIFTILMIKALHHHCTFDDRTKTDTTWDGPYHNGVSRSRIITRPHMRSWYASTIRIRWSDRANDTCLDPPLVSRKEKSPSDGQCQCQKEMDYHLLACQQILIEPHSDPPC
jgi:hypothetical protein